MILSSQYKRREDENQETKVKEGRKLVAAVFESHCYRIPSSVFLEVQ